MDLIIAGNVQTVLSGQVTQKTLCPVSVDKMPYALGGAALPYAKTCSIGETMVYEASGHIFTPAESLVEKRTLEAAFLMGVEQAPKHPIFINEKQTINALYHELVKYYPTGFAIIGTAKFSMLHIAYIKLSPIYGENINVYHDKYWTQECLKDCEVKLFGVVMPVPDPRAFYNNPGEEQSDPLASHTHVLMPQARHLLTQSELLSAHFWIEEIDAVKNYQEI